MNLIKLPAQRFWMAAATAAVWTMLFTFTAAAHANPVTSSLIFGEGSRNNSGSLEGLSQGALSPDREHNGYRTSVSGGNSNPSNPQLPEIVTNSLFSGSKALRFIVYGNGSGGDSGTFRSEVSLSGYNRGETGWENTVHWIGWAFQLDSNWPTHESRGNRTVIAQSHRLPSEPGSSPTWGIRTLGDGSLVLTQSFDGYSNTSFSLPVGVSDIRGRWVRAVMQIRYHGGNQGFIRLWFDDELILERRNIRTWQPNASRFGFYKFGVYAGWHQRSNAATKVMYLDDVRIADEARGGNYATVDPASYLDDDRPKPPQVRVE